MALSTGAFAADTGEIDLNIKGLRNDKGVVRVALFNSAQTYSADKFSADKSFQKAIAPIKNLGASVTLTDVPYGDYAVKLFHDEDNSGHFVTNIFGIPKVEYGFSNNAHGFMGPAPYEKAKFKLKNRKLEMPINMQGN